MELLTCNFSGKARREKFNGRDHLVVPVTMLRPQVLNGSKGPVFYPDTEIARKVAAWNGVPLVLDHPVNENGQHISARNPAVLNQFGLGHIWNATAVQGHLSAEAWFDIENTRRISPEALNKLESGTPIEVSTGLDAAFETLAAPGVFNGTSYSLVARDHQPDHLAVLIGKTGACSIHDGCGVFNEEQKSSIWNKLGEMLGLGLAPSVTNQEEQRSPSVPSKEKESEMALNATQKKSIIDNLIANCGCKATKSPWVEADREVLNGLSDEKLQALEESQKTLVANAAIVAAVKDGIDVPQPGKMVFNAEKKAWELEQVVNTPAVTPPNQPKNLTQYLAEMPPEMRAIVQNAFNVQVQEQQRLIQVITANARNPWKPEELAKMDVNTLRNLAAFAAPDNSATEAAPFGGQSNYLGMLPSFGGQPNGGSVLNSIPDDEPLDIPVLRFEDQGRKQA